MKYTAQKTKGIGAIVTLLVIGLIALVAWYWYVKLYPNQKTHTLYPPEADRVNAAPLSSNSLYLEELHTHKHVHVKEIKMASAGYIEIYLDTGTKRKSIGKSEILTPGVHTELTVDTSQMLSDGDVVAITLKDENGNQLTDENKNSIEVIKNVGMLMQHYDNEY